MGNLSAVILFGGINRWRQFGQLRLEEIWASGIFSEAIAVVNPPHDEAMREIPQTADRIGLPVKTVLSPINNMPYARNLGVASASASSVMICDDDDRFDPAALNEAYCGFWPRCRFGVLELPLAHEDGSPFHPQDASIMPQRPYERDERLLVMGMVHTPFLARRYMVRAVPFPHHMALRGEWVEWSTHLWRAGIPIFCSRGQTVAYEGARERKTGATASAEPNGVSLQHVLASMIFLCSKFELEPESFEGSFLRLRYLYRYFPEEALVVWGAVKYLGSCLAQNVADPESPVFCQLNDGIWPRCQNAYSHCRQVMAATGPAGPYPIKYNVGPYGLFAPGREEILRDCICRAQNG